MARKSSRSRKRAPSRGKREMRIEFRDDKGKTATIASSEQLQATAMSWRYRLTKRSRWKHRAADELLDLEEDLRQLEPALAEGDRLLPWLVSSSVVEIRIPYREESEGWAARIAPWEFMLNAVSDSRGRSGDFSVIRHLDRGRSRARSPARITKVLYLECVPGELREHYEFETERRLVRRRFPDAEVHALYSPTPEALQETVESLNPHVIHVAGVDIHQAREIFEESWDLDGAWNLDGVMLASENGEEPVPAQDFARLLNAGRTKPRLVFLNLYHSAARTAALCVAEGTQYAIGFQDTVDDDLAEMLFSEFYLSWSAARWQVLPAFVEAVGVLRSVPRKLTGTGIVLWSAHSLLDAQAQQLAARRRRRQERRRQPIEVGNYEWLEINIDVNESINYSIMHNDAGGIFASFSFRKFEEGTLRDVHVSVELHVGSESFPYRRTLDLVAPYTPIQDAIKVPLTSDLVRTVQEPLKTSVFVEVRHQDRVLRRDTWRVTLLPADEWRDDDLNRLWLPSFVLPRDPCVERIIDAAQSHLMTLADDRTRGFDGYQSIDVADPGDPETWDDLDIQVQAIWAALVYHYQIKYINPPPTYTESAQRLRTPTQVLRGGRGTCIDLAVLLAACLEYVEIYPVVFLLEGHAFVGYWRSHQSYEEFMFGKEKEAEEGDAEITPTAEFDTQAAWIVSKREYSEILAQITAGKLYPIESVGITSHGSFWDAVDEGIENLRDPMEFHSMVDVKRARENSLTPLPLKEERGHAE